MQQQRQATKMCSVANVVCWSNDCKSANRMQMDNGTNVCCSAIRQQRGDGHCGVGKHLWHISNDLQIKYTSTHALPSFISPLLSPYNTELWWLHIQQKRLQYGNNRHLQIDQVSALEIFANDICKWTKNWTDSLGFWWRALVEKLDCNFADFVAQLWWHSAGFHGSCSFLNV